MQIKIVYDDYKETAPLLAKAVSEELNTVCEHVPPAFPPRDMKLVILGAEFKKGKLSPKMKTFVPILSPRKTEYAAIFTCGGKQDKGLQQMVETLEKNNVKVVDVNCSCVGAKGKGIDPTAEDIANVKEFAKAVISKVYNK